MKKCKLQMVVTVIGACGVLCVNGQGDENTDINSFYRAKEFSIDAFASGSLGQETLENASGARVEHNGRLGAGVGLNYYFTRYVGIGGDAYTENTAHNFIDSASGNVLLRLPIGDTGIAPYIFGGAGHQFDQVSQSFGQGGAGIEFRFMKHAGFIVEARYVFADKTDNYGVARAGIRLNF
ncbi:MAG: outer membrane beta-barrel protein [Limisphaerales bacterium]